jgi:hypothetical protein
MFGRDFEVHLVRFQLDERIPRSHGIADILQPLRDDGLHD